MTLKFWCQMPTINSQTVVVFDLDDTLYAERTFQASGYRQIATQLSRLFHVNAHAAFNEVMASDSPDHLGLLLEKLALPQQLKSSLLDLYRTHTPDICLLPGAAALWQWLRQQGCAIAVITDGRSFTQRMKLAQLALPDQPDLVLVSEEIGVQKPDQRAFIAVEQMFPNKQYLYIADNPKKDFIAPRQRGWRSIGVRHLTVRVHPCADVAADLQPDVWVDSISEVKDKL